MAILQIAILILKGQVMADLMTTRMTTLTATVITHLMNTWDLSTMTVAEVMIITTIIEINTDLEEVKECIWKLASIH